MKYTYTSQLLKSLGRAPDTSRSTSKRPNLATKPPKVVTAAPNPIAKPGVTKPRPQPRPVPTKTVIATGSREKLVNPAIFNKSITHHLVKSAAGKTKTVSVQDKPVAETEKKQPKAADEKQLKSTEKGKAKEQLKTTEEKQSKVRDKGKAKEQPKPVETEQPKATVVPEQDKPGKKAEATSKPLSPALSLTEKLLGKEKAERLASLSPTPTARPSKKTKESNNDTPESSPKVTKQSSKSTKDDKKSRAAKKSSKSPSDVEKTEPTAKVTRQSSRLTSEVEKTEPAAKTTRQSSKTTSGSEKPESSTKVTRQSSRSTKESEKPEPSNKTTRQSKKDAEESQKEPERRRTRQSDTPKERSKDKSGNEEKKTSRKRAAAASDKETPEKPSKSRRTHKELPILTDTYQLKVVIKGHTESNIPVRTDDEVEDSKDLWCCGFEPSSEVAAICGSYTVLFLDTEQGRYIKKYTHSETQEIFYSMAWTTLDENECNVLAVAGRLGSIKLLNPLQNECYRYLFGHRKAVLALAFSKVHPSWLFSASADNTVRLWDIGSPTSETDDSMCLASFVLPENVDEPCALGVSYDTSTLIVGCRSGDMVKFNIPTAKLKKQVDECRENASDEGIEPGPITTVSQCYVYPCGDEWHEGYIDDLCILGQDGNKKNPMNNRIVSRGADDMEILIWDPAKSKKTDASIDKALEWPDSAECTGLKFKVIENEDQKVLIGGDYDGEIRIFNIGDGKKSKTLKDNSKEQFPATRILSHKMSEDLIRDVCCSKDTRTIVAVNNINTVFIWTASPMI